MKRALLLGLVTACGASTATSTSTPTPTATATATAASTSTATSTPTGGSVLIGDINAPKTFDPRPTLQSISPQLVLCYNQARVKNPDLRGKLTLNINVSEAGAVLSVDAAPGGHAADPALVSCINDTLKANAQFPKPGGTAIVVTPLVFRP